MKVAFRFLGNYRITSLLVLFAAVGIATTGLSRSSVAQDSSSSDAALLEGFRHVEVASVSDALEQLSGRKMYMTHKMRPIFSSRFAGFALTVSLKKERRTPFTLWSSKMEMTLPGWAD